MMYVSPRVTQIIELYDVCITVNDIDMYLGDRCITRYVCDNQYMNVVVYDIRIWMWLLCVSPCTNMLL